MTEIQKGMIVEADYNSGLYVGKVHEDRRNFVLVEVLAVLEHPDQGDLHNPGQVEGVAFFERKALAHHEMMNVQKRKVQPYTGEIPNYIKSLKESIEAIKSKLSEEETTFNQVSLERIEDLEKHYYNKLFE